MIDDDAYDIGEVSCSLPDLKYVFYALGAVVLAGALAIVVINKLRLW